MPYRQILELLPAAIYLTDAEGRITFFNEGAAELWGRRPEIGRDLWCGSWKIFRTDGSPLPLEGCPMAVALREGRSVRGEVIVVERPDGSRRVVTPYPDPIRDPTGAVTGAVNMLVDVTDRRRAEEALRASEERHRRVLSLLPAAVYTCEAPSGTITYFNEHAAALWGRAPRLGDLDDRFCGSVRLHHDDGSPLPHDRTPMALALRDGRSFHNESVVIERPDGTRIAVLVNIDPERDERGRVTGAINVFHDVTAIREAERALRESEERLREADRRKDEFIAMLGHELRNPLAALRNAIATATLDAAGSTRALEIAHRQTGHLGRLVDDLLDVARITQGRIALRSEDVSLREVVDQAVEATRPLMEARSHELTLTVPANDVHVRGDATRLEQVLVNLLTNAAKYTPPRGRIALVLQRRDADAILRVGDDGIGLAPDMLRHVFEPFAQAERPLDREEGGLGIGLSVARRLVELHGGEISASSTGLGEGSEFVVRLPALPEASEPAPALRAARPAAAARCVRVLMVEDNPDAAESLHLLLELLGHRVYVVHDGVAAIEAARASLPDVMLVDIGLPGIDGFEVARRVRADATLRGVLLIALTGYGSDEDRRRAIESGFDHHLVKPVDPDRLQHLIQDTAAALRTREPCRVH